jgi:hypothetical protein
MTTTKLKKSNVTIRDSMLLVKNNKNKFEDGAWRIDFVRSKLANVSSKKSLIHYNKKNR